jgi:hypothetical protein
MLWLLRMISRMNGVDRLNGYKRDHVRVSQPTATLRPSMLIMGRSSDTTSGTDRGAAAGAGWVLRAAAEADARAK